MPAKAKTAAQSKKKAKQGDGLRRAPDKRCSEFGGRSLDGRPCTRAAGWGTLHVGEGCCKNHDEDFPLTPRHQKFVEFYCMWHNTSRAYRAAFGETPTAGVAGFALIRKPKIKEAIAKYMTEQAMSREEVINRLSQIARGSLEPFVQARDGKLYIDLSDPECIMAFPLLKHLRQTERKIPQKSGGPIVVTQTDVEIHDALKALTHMGRVHGIFVDKTEVTGAGGGPILVEDVTVVRNRIANRLAGIASRMGGAPTGNGSS